MARSPVRINIGRKTVRSSVAYGDIQKGLRDELRSSLHDVIENFKTLVQGIEGATPEILAEVLQPTFDKSQVLCPVKTGALKNSGYVEARKLPSGAFCEIGYGKGGEPYYALMVHEIPAWHAPPTQDKFLQQPIEEDMHLYPEMLAAKIREVAGT